MTSPSNRAASRVAMLIASIHFAFHIGASRADDAAPPAPDITALLAAPILDAETPLREVRAFTSARIAKMPEVGSADEWKQTADQIRQRIFDQVIFRGEAKNWRDADCHVEWLGQIGGGAGYSIRKLRYEALPGMWIPALLYMPDAIDGKAPVVMNVNGHDGDGKVATYKQIRCINQAKRGMIALNVEWLGMGQLQTDGFSHTRMNQLDLCGTSGLAPFYLSMERGLDVLLSIEEADPTRVAVAGLSGGGWQTIWISSLDPRVTLANPVAGYSSYFTRVTTPADLGDSEQTPVDMAAVADYTHLTAMRAPRPTLLTYNDKDQCCFVASGALPPLIGAAEPIFALFGKMSHLRTHVNFLPGTHNFDRDNRLQLYRMFGDYFYPGDVGFLYEEVACDDEVKTKEELHVELPAPNADFHTLAVDLMKSLPERGELPASKEAADAWRAEARSRLAEVVKYTRSDVEAAEVASQEVDETKVSNWKLSIGGAWTVPAVAFARGEPKSTVLLVADEGRASVAKEVVALLADGKRVLAVDPFYFGESKIPERDYLYALLVSSVGERPLGVGAGQLAAIARWAHSQFGAPVAIHAVGPRMSLQSLTAAALEADAIDELTLRGAYGSLKEIIEQDLKVNDTPDLFCFGLLKEFDVRDLTAMIAPRKVRFVDPSERLRKEMRDLSAFYGMLGVAFEPAR